MRAFVIPVLILCSAAADACNVPVFRYALERWQADACDVIVFHERPLTVAQQTFVRQLQTLSVARQGTANIKVRQRNVADNPQDELGLLWQAHRERAEARLPFVLVRSRVAGRSINNWQGTLENAMAAGLLSSPVRDELSHRLLTGHSAVWLVLKSGQQGRDQAVVQMLQEQLQTLSRKIPMPEGIGLPGSELFSDIPLLMKFSVLEIDPADAREQYLIRLLTGFEPQAVDSGQPLVVPVFGRGRALEVIPAAQLDEGLIEDLTLFLCGACSCQVKEQNPGFDVLITTDWERELFGADATAQIPPRATVAVTSAEPVLLPIPPGTSRSQETAGVDQAAAGAALLRKPGSWLSGAIICLVAMMMAIVFGHTRKT